MFNLTAIAEGKKIDSTESHQRNKKPLYIFVSSLVALFILLYLGDIATSKKREKYLVSSAADLLEEQKGIIVRLSNYTFSRNYIKSASQDIKILSKVEEKFPKVTVITRDSLLGKPLLLGFTSYMGLGKDEEALKADYILSTSSEEREYLNSVFDGSSSSHRFSSNNGRYEIYYPVKTENGQIVIHLSQHIRYGKIGS
ncbi:hypothetical protein [Microbulbifer discodermiae]|uniref:hypothetical protein n=1 Tax=Microbulbifer sp. 2201CG32-9 TaxID=3232309 RepID=UPI00345C52CA